MKGDRIADEQVLRALESFWRLFAGRYRGRNVTFAYDLRNEPEVSWNTPSMREKWNHWLERKYGSADQLVRAWSSTNVNLELGHVSVPERKGNPQSQELIDYQLFREEVADEWTRRQVAAIKAADPDALVTVGLIQWSVPVPPGALNYSGFRPARQAPMLDFMEIHFYPLAGGFYEYHSADDETRNLDYLETVIREVAQPGKPMVLAEFGWYGGGLPARFNQGRHPSASEEQQARWCREVIETTAGKVVGWLNWGLYDHPEAGDVSQLTGLLTADGRLKAWGQEFKIQASKPHELRP